jgi:hypothetical protein
VNDDLKINIMLQAGAITATVVVKSETIQVELGTPANSTTIEGVQVRDLTLNTRNYEQLVSPMPGVSANTTDELYIGTRPLRASPLPCPTPSTAIAIRPITGPWTESTTWTAAAIRDADDLPQ